MFVTLIWFRGCSLCEPTTPTLTNMSMVYLLSLSVSLSPLGYPASNAIDFFQVLFIRFSQHWFFGTLATVAKNTRNTEFYWPRSL